jgi:hypothetical protein
LANPTVFDGGFGHFTNGDFVHLTLGGFGHITQAGGGVYRVAKSSLFGGDLGRLTQAGRGSTAWPDLPFLTVIWDILQTVILVISNSVVSVISHRLGGDLPLDQTYRI